MARNFKVFIASAREHLKTQLPKRQIRAALAIIAKRFRVAEAARDAYRRGIPQGEGPVWFGEDNWKTEFWQRQWEWQKAFDEGAEVRERYGDRDTNPYRQTYLPFTSRLIELENCWNRGFDGKEL